MPTLPANGTNTDKVFSKIPLDPFFLSAVPAINRANKKSKVRDKVEIDDLPPLIRRDHAVALDPLEENASLWNYLRNRESKQFYLGGLFKLIVVLLLFTIPLLVHAALLGMEVCDRPAHEIEKDVLLFSPYSAAIRDQISSADWQQLVAQVAAESGLNANNLTAASSRLLEQDSDTKRPLWSFRSLGVLGGFVEGFANRFLGASNVDTGEQKSVDPRLILQCKDGIWETNGNTLLFALGLLITCFFLNVFISLYLFVMFNLAQRLKATTLGLVFQKCL